MNFLVDAQLPRRLSEFFAEAGHDSTHTLALPDGNRTSEREVVRVADAEDRVVVTKDRDFRDGHLLHGEPRRLLIVATGNVSNEVLLGLFRANLQLIIDAFAESSFVELGPSAVVMHP